MRMRRMKNLDVRMERCAALRIAEPALLKGNWRSLKPDATALWVEVGVLDDPTAKRQFG